MTPDLEFPTFHDSLDEVAPPSCNPHLFGHETAIRRLAEAVNAGRLHHGLVFEGEAGIGKATTAFHLANWLLEGAPPTLDGRIPAPDTASPVFRQIAQNAHPNLLYLTRQMPEGGKRFRQVITVDDVRRIQRFTGLSAADDVWRVTIIDAANDMNRNASNALLKILEEPPARTLFILIAQGAGGLLPTIRSRTQTIRFQPLAKLHLGQALAAADASLEPGSGACETLCELAHGSVRRALVMARYGGLELETALSELLRHDRFDTVSAHKLADIAGARDGDMHERLLQELLLARVREEARLRAASGDLHGAGRLARLEASLLERNRVSAAYNLNRKQEFLNAVSQTHELFRTLAA